MRVSIAELETLGLGGLKRLGYGDEEAARIFDVLLYAELRGNDQGVVKLIGEGIRKDPSAGPMEIQSRTAVSARIDGNRNAGILVMRQAADLVIEVARGSGFGLVGTFNTNTSTGALGYYARQVAESGFICFAFAGSRPAVAPLGSYEPKFGTNPIAAGIPTDNQPFVFDMATSAITWYSLVAAKEANRAIPSGVALDQLGAPTSDPGSAMAGALRSFDSGHKSYGLSMLVALLTGPLVGALPTDQPPESWGNLIIAFDPGLIREREAAATDVTALITSVKGAKRLPGTEEILVPGERGDRLAERNREAGTVDLDDAVYHALAAESHHA